MSAGVIRSPLALAALPVPALAVGLESLPGLSGANLPPALGAAVRGAAAVDRDRCRSSIARFWHAHFGKIAAAWSVALIVPFALIFGSSHAASSRACGRRGVPSVRRHPVRALHDRRRHLRARPVRRHPGAQHRHPRAGRRDREPHGHDRRFDAADPSAAHRQRGAAAQGAHDRVLHPARRQCRRRAVATRRSAAVHRLSQGRGFLLGAAKPRRRRRRCMAAARCCRSISRSTRGSTARRVRRPQAARGPGI